MLCKAKGINATHYVSKISINREDHSKPLLAWQENPENGLQRG
jgi:hypothetical protein